MILASTTTTIFQYKHSTRIGYILGLIGSMTTFFYGLKSIVTKIIKEWTTTSSSKDLNLTHKMTLLCIFSYIYNFFSFFFCFVLIYFIENYINTIKILLVKYSYFQYNHYYY